MKLSKKYYAILYLPGMYLCYNRKHPGIYESKTWAEKYVEEQLKGWAHGCEKDFIIVELQIKNAKQVEQLAVLHRA